MNKIEREDFRRSPSFLFSLSKKISFYCSFFCKSKLKWKIGVLAKDKREVALLLFLPKGAEL